MPKKIDVDEADELDRDIAFCGGVFAVMGQLAGAKIGNNAALAEAAQMEPGGLGE